MKKKLKQKSIDQNDWRNKMRARGWHHLSTVLPPEVAPLMFAYKQYLMDEYRLNRLKEVAGPKQPEINI